MSNDDVSSPIQQLDVTIWVGKSGLDPIEDELRTQLDERGTVKVKFLESARAGASADALAEALADRCSGSLVDVRGHTAVFESE